MLRTCLPLSGRLSGAELAWALGQIGRPEAGLRWLLPLLAVRPMQEEIGDHPLVPKLKAARLYEAKRRRRFEEIAGETIALVGQAAGTPILSRGEMLSSSAYPAPEARHLHDLDLIVEDVSAAAAALVQAGYRRVAAEPGRLHHSTGMGIALHDSPLPAEDRILSRERLMLGARREKFGGSPVLVPPDDLVLLHVLLLASARPATQLSWAADGWMAVQRGLKDWSNVGGLEGPEAFWAFRGLAFLARSLDAQVPAEVLAQLARGAQSLRPIERIGLFRQAAVLRGRRALVRHVGRGLLPKRLRKLAAQGM